MNSLQISDLAGTNFHLPDGSVTTTLYISTQPKNIQTERRHPRGKPNTENLRFMNMSPW